MTLTDILAVLSFAVGIAAIGLAVYTLNMSARAERRSKQNFTDTQNMMRDFYEKTKEVLNEIDKRATNTENLISGSQKELLSTITNIINETVIPKKVDKAEEIGMLFFQQLLTDPEKAVNSLNALLPLIDKIEQS